MTKEVIYKILIMSGLLPAVILLILTIIGLTGFLSADEISSKDFILLAAMILGILGYVGLLTSLIYKNKPILNFILLLSGVTGFILFTSFEGNGRAWRWIITMEEPGGWFIYAWPSIVSIIGIVVNILQIVRSLRQKITDKYFGEMKITQDKKSNIYTLVKSIDFGPYKKIGLYLENQTAESTQDQFNLFTLLLGNSSQILSAARDKYFDHCKFDLFEDFDPDSITLTDKDSNWELSLTRKHGFGNCLIEFEGLEVLGLSFQA